MKRARRFISLALLASMSFTILSCSDQAPVAPDVAMPAPQADLIGDLLGTTTGLLKTLGLLKCKATYAQTTQTVGKLGGVVPESHAQQGLADVRTHVDAEAPGTVGVANVDHLQRCNTAFCVDAVLDVL